jgi:hypothetical protein
MRRPRELELFSMSALDVLAMATGVFVLLLVMMMPYYRHALDAEAELTRLNPLIATAEAEAAALGARAADATATADAIAAEAGRLAAAAAAAERRAADARAAASRLAAAIPRPAPPAPTPPPPGGTPVVQELDLVFVIDRTASMTPAIRELAANLASIVNILERLVPSLRIGIVAYSDRDTGQNPITILPLTPTESGLRRIIGFLESLQASTIGSRTVDEDVLLGLQAAVAMPLRATASQSLVLIGDAIAHPPEVQAALTLVRSFVAARPQRTVSALFVTTPTASSRGGVDRDFFREIASAGRGSFTDHAGSMIESVLASVLLK